MDRTSWKPKIYKATEAVDYKAEEEGTSDGAKKGWLTRKGSGMSSISDNLKQKIKQDAMANQDIYGLSNFDPDVHMDGDLLDELRSAGVSDDDIYDFTQTISVDPTKEGDFMKEQKKYYDESTQNTLDTLNQSKVNGFPFFSYVGQPEKIISDEKGGIILYGMKKNPNNIRRVDIKYDEGRDTYTVSFMSNRNKPKGEYNDVYFDQLSGLIAGNKGLGVESYAKENIDTVDDYFDYVDEEPDERKCEFCGAKITSLFNKKYMIDHVNSVHDAGLNPTDGQKLNKTFPYWGESYATEDDYKYDWDQLTSLAQKALSNIGYDKKSWNQEPEDIRKEMEKVAYSEENWKEVANKFYKEELNKGKKNGGESQPAYGYGSATGRMSPIEAWNQGADVYGDMGYDPSLRNPIFTDFRGLKWNELPTDIQEAWKSELGYYTQGEGIVDNIEKQLNKFGVNLDRDPEQVEESKASEDYWADDKLVDKYFVVDPESEYVWCGICGQEFYFDNSSMIYHIPNEHPELTESKATEDYDYEPKLDCLNCDGKGCGDCHGTGIYGESKATEAEDDWVDKYFEFEDWIENGEHYGYLRTCKLCGMRHESGKIGEQRDHLINNHGFTLNELEGNIPSYEGFNQGLYGYVDAKCKTCGIEFDSISDMDDHYAMNSDHVSNLNDLNSDIPNSD